MAKKKQVQPDAENAGAVSEVQPSESKAKKSVEYDFKPNDHVIERNGSVSHRIVAIEGDKARVAYNKNGEVAHKHIPLADLIHTSARG